MNTRLPFTALLGCLALALLATVAQAAPDDGEKAANEDAQVQNARLLVNQVDQFDQWMFQGVRTASGARSRIERRLKLQLAALELKHQLTAAQKQKLELAARGDVKRLFDEVEALRLQFRDVQNDGNMLGQMWQQIQPLQKQFTSGPFGRDSLFAKVLTNTLTAEQNAENDAIQRERRAFRFRATLEVSLALLEDTVPLTGEQRGKLLQLLLDKTPPPASFGQYDYYYVLYQMSQLDNKEIAALLDERQWELLQAHLQQMRGMKQMLIQNGVLEGEANDNNVNGFLLNIN